MGISRRRALGLLAGTGLGALAGCSSDHRTTQPRRTFGVLDVGATLSPAQLRREHDAGIRLRVLAVSWSYFEPHQGQVGAGYLAGLKSRMARYRSAGFQVVLDLGMQHPPAWIFDQTNSRFLNQYGSAYVSPRPGGAGVNAVFNAALRTLQETYLERLLQELGHDFYAIRLGWGYYGELGYPNPTFKKQRNCYWAYDDIAQGRAKGLPFGMRTCPVPGWKPGTASQNHQSARQFANWYLESMHNYHDWQIHAARRHFGGTLVMLFGSNTIIPAQIATAVAGDLNGGSDSEKSGLLQRGFDYGRFAGGITDRRVALCTTWLNSPSGDDASADPTRWTPVHHLATFARSKGLAVWAENGGGDDYYNTMVTCFRRVQTYDVRVLSWAFDAQLYQPEFASLDNYSRLIAQHGGPT